MKLILSVIVNAIVKTFSGFLFGWFKEMRLINQGKKLQKQKQERADDKARQKASAIRADIDSSNIADIRNWLRKRKK